MEDQSSRQKRKQLFILLLIILFTLIIVAIISIFTVLKHRTESNSLSFRPIAAIHSVCRFTRYYQTCVNSLSPLKSYGHKIHASYVFKLFISAALFEFYSIGTLPQKLGSKIENQNIELVLTDCGKLFTDTVSQLNRSLIMIENYLGPDEEILAFNEVMMRELRNLTAQATNNVDRCLDGLVAEGATPPEIAKMRLRTEKAKMYMLNSLAILEKKDVIKEMFDPSVQSILASFILARENDVLTIALFCSQYLVLVFLFCSLMRVFLSRTRK
ncbi:hypothetical protein Salat_1561500 [Sesamum alatum]|uniref:Pectinesterase inhibitor domain-containing protein n=1 Tax=Sesamum alatum TaxID=300844 RepID=A0AAE2CMT8_9LAMI|nr:hypothetical protein Salat_1561500 [Sesamum alatum]